MRKMFLSIWVRQAPKVREHSNTCPNVLQRMAGNLGRALALPAIKELLTRPWFSRTWVLQEVYMSKSATVWCGEDHVSWERFRKVIHYFLQKGSFSQIANLPFALLIQDRDWSFPDDLLHLLHLARECGATDPKDKYFALLSLLKKARNSQRLLNVNYSNTATEIFTTISTQLIQQRGLGPTCLQRWMVKPSRATILGC